MCGLLSRDVQASDNDDLAGTVVVHHQPQLPDAFDSRDGGNDLGPSFRGSADQVPLPLSFRRNDRLRASLPVVGATNRSMEQPLGG